jgi:hypothetical protein
MLSTISARSFAGMTSRILFSTASALDQGKAVVQDLANRASEAGRQAMNRAGEFVGDVAPQAKEMASNLYAQGARSGQFVRQYAAQDPLVAMLVAGVLGFVRGR